MSDLMDLDTFVYILQELKRLEHKDSVTMLDIDSYYRLSRDEVTGKLKQINTFRNEMIDRRIQEHKDAIKVLEELKK